MYENNGILMRAYFKRRALLLKMLRLYVGVYVFGKEARALVQGLVGEASEFTHVNNDGEKNHSKRNNWLLRSRSREYTIRCMYSIFV